MHWLQVGDMLYSQNELGRPMSWLRVVTGINHEYVTVKKPSPLDRDRERIGVTKLSEWYKDGWVKVVDVAEIRMVEAELTAATSEVA